ncbi:MAG: hypothetical protein ACQESR_07440 [Planctomycetota bacterium]
MDNCPTQAVLPLVGLAEVVGHPPHFVSMRPGALPIPNPRRPCRFARKVGCQLGTG